ncbi:MAG: pyridoxamine 5'-phosphate oxidase family protein [Acidimicrobiia bacterium]
MSTAEGAMDEPAGPVDHGGIQVLTAAECDELLASTPVGRIAFVAAGEPVVLPVTYRYHAGSIVFRTARGEKLEAAGRRAPVAFEIDGWDAEGHTGWSVLVKGVAEEVLRPEELDELQSLGLRPWSDAVGRRLWIRVRADEVTGRRIR